MRPTSLRSLSSSTFLVVVSLIVSSVQANLSFWDVDFGSDNNNGCMSHKAQIQTAYDEVGLIVDSALKNLDTISKAQPAGDPTSKEVGNYERIARNALVFFGIRVDVGRGPENTQFFTRAHDVYTKMQSIFLGVEPPRWIDQGLKPAFACGDKGWKYVGPDDDDPASVEDPKQKLSDRKSNGQRVFPNGAWYWKGRYIFAEPGTAPGSSIGLCGRKNVAVTSGNVNLITWCDELWARKDLASFKSSATVDTSIDDMGYGAISATFVHEFAHYFGRPLPDQPAVGKDGDPIWIGPDGKATTTKPSVNPQRAIVYGYQWISKLAKQSIIQNKDWSVNTADAYSYFGIASFIDRFDWSERFAKALAYRDASVNIFKRSVLFKA